MVLYLVRGGWEMRAGMYREERGRAVCVFVSHADDILVLCKVVDGYWSLPGGDVEINENAEEAAQRNLRKETGIAVSLNKLSLLGTHELYRGNRDLLELASYEISLLSEPNVVLDPNNHSESQWKTPGDILRDKKGGLRIFPGLIQMMIDFKYLCRSVTTDKCRAEIRRTS